MVDVSYIVPARGPDEYLDLAINSLLEQDFVDLEIIIVWDSKDKVAGQVWEADGRVRRIDLGRKLGTPGALNAGLDAAQGRFIARLDADDLAAPTRTTMQVEYLTGHPEVIAVGSWAKLIDHEGNDLGSLQAGTGDVTTLLSRRNPIVHSSLMVRRQSMTMVGGYDIECTRMQDYELLCRLATIGCVHILGSELVSYRVHEHQSSRHTSPFAPYTKRVLLSRRRLARHLGMGSAKIRMQEFLWMGAQILRHFGLRAPAHFRRSRPAGQRGD